MGKKDSIDMEEKSSLKYINETDENYTFEGNWNYSNTGSSAFINGDVTSAVGGSDKVSIVKFSFVGDILKIYGQLYYSRSSNREVIVDDVVVGSYSIYGALSTAIELYTKTFANKKRKNIQLINKNLDKDFLFDGIHINIDGEILPYLENNEEGKKELKFYKTHLANLKGKVESGIQALHFTEDGGIYTYDNEGNLKQMGGSNEIILSSREW